MIDKKYEPSILPEISAQALDEIPAYLKKKYQFPVIKHMLAWRHHLEGDYIVKCKNFENVKKKRDEAKKNAFIKSEEITRLSELLKDFNFEMLAAHNLLREIENKIILQTQVIEEGEQNERNRVSSKVISYIALVVAILAAASPWIRTDNSEARAKKIAQEQVNEFFEKNYKPELLKALEVEAASAYQDKLKSLEIKIKNLKKQISAEKSLK